MTQPSRITVEEIDRLLENLDAAIYGPVNADSKCRIMRASSSESQAEGTNEIRLELPTELWKKFVEHCAQNELDPAQQLREAVAGYYKVLLKTLRIQTRLREADQSKFI